MSEEYSDEQAAKNHDLVKVWWDEFVVTAGFGELTDLEKNEGSHILSSFTDFMYDYEGYTPEYWTDNALYSVCTDVMPRKVMADEDFFGAVSPVLTAFFEFLDSKSYQKNAARLANRARSIGNAIVEASQDSSNWGMGKSFLSMARRSGVDLTDQSQMQQFSTAYNESLASVRLPSIEASRPSIEPYRNPGKVGRNNPCPCGSGKKFKKCCSGNLRVVDVNERTGSSNSTT